MAIRTENPSEELCGELRIQAPKAEDCQDEVMCMSYLLAFAYSMNSFDLMLLPH